MSKIVEYIIEQEEFKEAPKEKILDFVINKAIMKPELETFIKAIMPQHGNFFFFQGKELKNHPEYTDIDKYALMLSYYSNVKENLYIVPFGFDGWANGNNAISTRCVFVDIDAPRCAPELDAIEESYSNEFKQAHPSFIIKSGNGLHFYFLIPELNLTNPNDLKNRETIINKLITLYRADVHCKDLARKMRCPMSYNCKETITQSTFIYSNDALMYTIPQLLNLDIDKIDVDNYIKEQWEIIANKRNTTRQKNGTTKIIKESKKHQKIVDKYRLNCNLEYEYKFNKHTPTKNRLFDLHNYFIRHNGEIFGYRNNFVFIIANTLKIQGKTLEEAIKYIEKYFENDDFMNEAIIIIKNTFKTQKTYKFSNEKIAEILGFTKDDLAQSYGLYDKESIKEHNKAKAKKQSNKRKAKRQKNKDSIKNYVRCNIDAPEKELVAACGVSRSTIARIKKSILNGD